MHLQNSDTIIAFWVRTTQRVCTVSNSRKVCGAMPPANPPPLLVSRFGIAMSRGRVHQNPPPFARKGSRGSVTGRRRDFVSAVIAFIRICHKWPRSVAPSLSGKTSPSGPPEPRALLFILVRQNPLSPDRVHLVDDWFLATKDFFSLNPQAATRFFIFFHVRQGSPVVFLLETPPIFAGPFPGREQSHHLNVNEARRSCRIDGSYAYPGKA